MVYLGYGLIVVVALVAIIVSLRELANPESRDVDVKRDLPDSRRLVLHSSKRRPIVERPNHRSW